MDEVERAKANLMFEIGVLVRTVADSDSPWPGNSRHYLPVHNSLIAFEKCVRADEKGVAIETINQEGGVLIRGDCGIDG